jgi:TRAP-type mannitol/chloroaromatic compound transport system permease small subunit
MIILKKILSSIDRISEIAGSWAKWCAWILVIVGAYDTIMRHFFNAPTIWAYDILCMAGGILYVIGWSYDYLHGYHIRVDMLYNKFSPRNKALLNIIFSIILFFPLMGALLKSSISWAIKAWKINEIMISTFWYPPATPYRVVFALGILFLTLQGIANFIRDLYFAIRGEPIN